MGIPDDSTRAAAQAAAGAAGVAASLLEQLAERVGGKASVTAVFGEPVVSGATTVIPVARVSFGFGGGTGRGTGRRRAPRGEAGSPDIGEGGGGGGGAGARPLGFIEISGGAARYRPIRDPWGDVVLPLAALALGLVMPKLARAVAGRAPLAAAARRQPRTRGCRAGRGVRPRRRPVPSRQRRRPGR